MALSIFCVAVSKPPRRGDKVDCLREQHCISFLNRTRIISPRTGPLPVQVVRMLICSARIVIDIYQSALTVIIQWHLKHLSARAREVQKVHLGLSWRSSWGAEPCIE